MFDFDTVIDRKNSSSTKWTPPMGLLTPSKEDALLPMWIADMDFKSPPCVLEALHRTIDSDVFGYTDVSDSLLHAVCAWQEKQHNWSIKPEWISFQSSVVTSISLIVQAFSKEGEGVLIQPPVYGPFRHTPSVNNRLIVEAPLKEEQGRYIFDADIFEAAITKETKIFILCNPHNPIGKVWTLAELTAIGEVCLKHKLLVIADEIHQDFVLNEDVEQISFAGICPEFADITITCVAPSKTFNLAGLQTSITIISNEKLRKTFRLACEQLDLMQSNLLGLVACEAAYTHGAEWLGALKNYLRQNQQIVAQYISEIPDVKFIAADALYLAWLDFRDTGFLGKELHRHLIMDAGVWLDDGLKFGPQGSGFARLNFACPQSTLIEGLQRIKQTF